MKRFLFLVFTIFVASQMQAQNYLIGSTALVSTCNGSFFDSGGPSGYAGNTYQVITFSSASSNCLSFSFEDFDLGFGAELKVYNGNSTNGILIGTYSGTNAPQGLSGEQLTFEYIPPFTTIGNIPGWSAEISCVNCSLNQVRSDPASDCEGAIPLCANQTVIVSTNQYTDTGIDPNDEDGSCYSGTGSGGSVWYSFSPQTNGLLDFAINPSGSTDYDYVLFDATNGCNNLQEISCNYSGTYGVTGLTTNSSNYQNSYSGCSGGSPFNSAPASCGVWNEAENVVTTHTYMLSVNFYGGSNDGFTLQFQNDASTVPITDNIPPTFANVTQPGCGGAQIQVNFSENINCTTLQATDFTLSGHTVTIASTGCVSGMTLSTILNISPALAPGTYTLTGLTMQDMCGNNLNDNFTFTIANTPVTVTVNGSNFCQGTQGTITATGTGTGNLTYNWSNGATGSTITVSAGGNYCVTVSDACSNTSTACKNITMLPAPSISTTVNCNGAGTIATLAATGCSGNLTWNVWDTVCTTTCIGVIVFGNCIGTWFTYCDSAWAPIGTTPSVNVNSPFANQYMANCTAANGCSTQELVEVNCSSSISVTMNSATICSGSCANLTATVTGSGGPYTYTWSPVSFAGAGPNSVCPTSNTTYYVTVSNGSGNSATTSGVVTVIANPTPAITGNLSICNGSSTILDAGSGYSSYNWSSGGSSQTISVNTAGTYSVTVTNSNGCSGTASVTVIQSSNLTPTITGGLSICNGSSTILDAGSGYSSYNWSNSTSLQTTTVNTAGAYSVTVSNASGCSGSATVTVIQSASLSPAITGPATMCIGSTATLDAGSGYSSYLWSNSAITQTISITTGGTYSVTVTNASGCSGSASIAVTTAANLSISVTPASASVCPGSPVQLTASGATNYTWSPATGLSATTGSIVNASPTSAITYNVTGTDASGCSGTSSIAISMNSISATASSTNENCSHSNGTATATPTGTCGTGFTYMWNSVPQQSSQIATGLTAGTYTVTVSCGSCTTTASTTISNLPGPSASISNITSSTCNMPNGTATVTAVGGVAPYSYAWNSAPPQYSGTLSNVTAGSYNVTVTDANNCNAMNTVTINNISGPTATIASFSNATCGMSDGSANLSITGGTAPYSFNWNSNPGQNGQNLTGVPAGTYTVTATDVNSCSATSSVTINQSAGPSATTSTVNDICGQGIGTATANPSGGTGTYSYIWSNGQTSQTATGLISGNYSVTVSDGGCSTIANASVMETLGPTAGFSANPTITSTMDGPVSFLDHSSGSISTWQWNMGDGTFETGESFDHLFNNIGTFLVTLVITDANGCTDTVSDTIVVKEIFTLYIPNTFTPNGDGLNDFFAPKGLSVDPENFDMKIFDRWGNIIFQTTKWYITSSEPWNGTKNNQGSVDDVIQDVYVYRIKVKELQGSKHQYIGRISLLP